MIYDLFHCHEELWIFFLHLEDFYLQGTDSVFERTFS